MQPLHFLGLILVLFFGRGEELVTRSDCFDE